MTKPRRVKMIAYIMTNGHYDETTKGHYDKTKKGKNYTRCKWEPI